MLKKCLILTLVPLHGLIYLGYYFIFGRHLNYPKDIYRISKWKKFVELGDGDIELAFRVLRKIFFFIGTRQICLHSSVVLFWLADQKVEIHFSINPPLAHAWVRYLDRIYSTHHSYYGDTVFSMAKSSENQKSAARTTMRADL